MNDTGRHVVQTAYSEVENRVDFQSLEVVCRGSETQLQVTENLPTLLSKNTL